MLGGGFDAMLDNVDVSMVPEPSSFLSLLCAFGGAAALATPVVMLSGT